jgi:acetate kinase
VVSTKQFFLLGIVTTVDVRARQIVCIDGGSSSLKLAVFDVGDADERLVASGGIDRLRAAEPVLRIRDERGPPGREVFLSLRDRSPIEAALTLLDQLGLRIDGVGHRLVFGGPTHELPIRVTDELIESLNVLVPFDPLHLPAALAAIREIAIARPNIAQVVCFDTAFHRTMPEVAQRLPLPRKLWLDGLRRYGYHGLSYESIVDTLGTAGVQGRTIVAHLGSGASLAALRDGRPLDTTMGFSPLGGLMMSTRPGDIDPGALLYLLRADGATTDGLAELLTRESGLLGVSETSGDMLTLLETRRDDAQAHEAIELFVYQVQKYIGALIAVLGGLDRLVFTGGIGEHAPAIRWEIANGLAHLGIVLDPERNAANAATISADGAPVVALVIAAQENRMVARHTFDALAAQTV